MSEEQKLKQQGQAQGQKPGIKYGSASSISDIHGAVTTKYNQVFMLTDQRGDILPDNHGFGLYFRDMRYLNHLAARAHGRVYSTKPVTLGPLVAFILRGFPRLTIDQPEVPAAVAEQNAPAVRQPDRPFAEIGEPLVFLSAVIEMLHRGVDGTAILLLQSFDRG